MNHTRRETLRLLRMMANVHWTLHDSTGVSIIRLHRQMQFKINIITTSTTNRQVRKVSNINTGIVARLNRQYCQVDLHLIHQANPDFSYVE